MSFSFLRVQEVEEQVLLIRFALAAGSRRLRSTSEEHLRRLRSTSEEQVLLIRFALAAAQPTRAKLEYRLELVTRGPAHGCPRRS